MRKTKLKTSLTASFLSKSFYKNSWLNKQFLTRKPFNAPLVLFNCTLKIINFLYFETNNQILLIDFLKVLWKNVLHKYLT